MGKIHSKQVCKRTAPEGECFLVNTKVTSVKDLVDAINCGSSFSEAFVELEGSEFIGSGKLGGDDNSKIEITDLMECCGKPDCDRMLDPRLLNIPLRVTLPPLNSESNLLKLLTADRLKHEDCSNSIQTDTTDNNHGSEKSNILKGEANEGNATIEDSGPGLQEWLFTLYDFDDLGKITKEDISGLLKSLYDTVGSVITLQQQGARVLKLHLTVTPGDKPNCQDARCADATSADAKVSRAGVKEQCHESAQISDCANAISSSIPNGHRCCAALNKVPRSRCPPLSHFRHGSPRMPGHKTQENRPITTCGRDRGAGDADKRDVRNYRGLSITRRQSFSGGFEDALPAAHATDGAPPPPAINHVHRRQQPRQQCSGTSKRLSHFDERHLAHLIQRNMDLNDQHQQRSHKSRRHHNSFVSKRQTRDSFANQSRTFPSEESAQRRNYYLDLAGIENYDASNDRSLSSAQPSFGVFGDEELARPQRKIKSKSSPSTAKHSRFISARTDAHGTDTICEEDEMISANANEPSGDKPTQLELPMLHLKAAIPQLTPLFNDVEAISASHYQRRHRHRERNQNRAMKQVAEWIEKEHVDHKTEQRVVVVQRHEHHHIHEHFHHHIHHNGNT